MNLLAEKIRTSLIVIGVIGFASQHGFAERPINATSNLQELTEAAERGHDHVEQHLLGRRYYEGSGGAPKDAEIAVKWFQKSSSNGGMNALMYMSACFKDGEGVRVDENSSARYADRYLEFFHKELKARAIKGDLVARQELDGIYHFELGKIYYRRGVLGHPSQMRNAVQEFELSIKDGNTDSLSYLAACYVDGNLGIGGDAKSKELFDDYLEMRYPELRNRANQGDTQAKKEILATYNSTMGRIYFDEGSSCWLAGRTKAVEFLTASVAEGHEDSLGLLGYCYKLGYGVSKDEVKANGLMKQYTSIFVAKANVERQKVSEICDRFLAAEKPVSIADIRAGDNRWKLIDSLIEFKVSQLKVGKKLTDEKMQSIEKDAKLYLDAIRELEKFKEVMERAGVSYGRLTDTGMQNKIAIEKMCSETRVRVSVALDEAEDLEFVGRIAMETGIIPGEQRALNAARSHGFYSFEHVSELFRQVRKQSFLISPSQNGKTALSALLQTRRAGFTFYQPFKESAIRRALQAIASERHKDATASDGAISLLAYDDDSEGLLLAGLLMLEVSRICDEEKKLAPTESDKAELRALLSEYQYLLERAANRQTADFASSSKRSNATRSALAFSWNACRMLIDFQ